MNEIQFKAQLVAAVLPSAIELEKMEYKYYADDPERVIIHPDALQSKSITRAIQMANTIIERLNES